MRSNASAFILVFVILVFQPALAAGRVEAKDRDDVKIKGTLDDKEYGRFYLKYSPAKRSVWVESEKSKLTVLLDRFGRNENPELVGADQRIRFIGGSVFNIGDRKFIAAYVAHRSRSNDGSGQCGSGSEEYFLAVEILPSQLAINNRAMVQSCFYPYELEFNNDGAVSGPMMQ